MKVYFDYQIFYLQRYGGISRYFFELANELNKLNGLEAKIIVPYHGNQYLEDAGKKDFIYTYNSFLKKLYHNRFLNKKIDRNESVAQKLCDSSDKVILHETYYTNRFKVKAPKVITIHDMIYELFSNNNEDEKEIIRCKKKAIDEADMIITVSENTKKDLLSFYPQVENKTHVVYHGVNQSAKGNVGKYHHKKPFILHVGNRGWYKNFDLLLELYCSDKTISDSFDLISFGGGPMTSSESEMIIKHNKSDKVFFLSGDDNLLNSLYATAALLVYISNYEGFGMPVLEAMSLSCPVICSNTSSIPEVAGKAALLVDPKNIEEIRAAMNSVLFNSEVKTNLIKAGAERAKLFSWQKCAAETHEVYKKLI
jgi:glycosyltransferase involved in cell wall biosynthesis